MQITTQSQQYHAGVVVGAFLGTYVTYIIMSSAKSRFMRKILEESKLKSQIIHWMVYEGRDMSKEEFSVKYNEKAKFINLVTK